MESFKQRRGLGATSKSTAAKGSQQMSRNVVVQVSSVNATVGTELRFVKGKTFVMGYMTRARQSRAEAEAAREATKIINAAAERMELALDNAIASLREVTSPEAELLMRQRVQNEIEENGGPSEALHAFFGDIRQP